MDHEYMYMYMYLHLPYLQSHKLLKIPALQRISFCRASNDPAIACINRSLDSNSNDCIAEIGINTTIWHIHKLPHMHDNNTITTQNFTPMKHSINLI